MVQSIQSRSRQHLRGPLVCVARMATTEKRNRIGATIFTQEKQVRRVHVLQAKRLVTEGWHYTAKKVWRRHAA